MRMAVKLQSAMEYLMTYGWAILIIAIVLIALFSLGVFSSNNLGTSCISESGFLCTNMTLTNILPPGTPTNTLAMLTFTVGQASGQPEYNALVAISLENTTLLSNFGPVVFSVNVPLPAATQIGVDHAPPSSGTIAYFQSGTTNSVTMYIGKGWIFYPASFTPDELGQLITSNAIGTSMSGYVWIGYNASSEYEPRILIQRIARFSVKLT